MHRARWLLRVAPGTCLSLLLMAMGSRPAAATVSVQNLRCEYAVDPLGIDVVQPRLSWELVSDRRAQTQTAYQVVVTTDVQESKPGKTILWDSGKVSSDQSAQVVYAGKAPVSGQRCYWSVRVWDRDGKPSAYARPAFWEMGLLHPADWQAKWIGFVAPGVTPGAMGPTPYLRKAFALDRPVRRARLYATALGLYVASLNGQRVGHDIFRPGWTDYHKRVPYQTYDVTDLVRQGDNALGIVLADGWYAGYVGLGGRNRYGALPLARCRLQVDYADGSNATFATDETWKADTGPILQSDMLMGETYDARKEIPGWDSPGFDDSAWQPVVTRDAAVELDAQTGPPVRVIQEIKPRNVTKTAKGAFIFDLGQNMVGWARLKVRGKTGDTVTLRVAEMLNPDGTIYTANYRGARCTDHYTLRGGGAEVWEPQFTFRGFRYVELTGYPGKPGIGAITGIVLHTDSIPAGTFACSSPLVNQLQHNIVWGQRGNYLEVPTDCPQRDERLGWMGDAQIFVRTATYNEDVAGFFTKWLVDVDDAQRPDGAFTDVSPGVAAGAGTAAWGDAGVVCPWTIYLAYGDTRIIEQNYPAMAKWVEYCAAHSSGLLRPASGYGDWLSINAGTPTDVLATAYFAYSTRLLSRMARAIGNNDDATKYEDLFQQIKAAFDRAYVSPDGHIKGDTQTDYVLALRFDLLPPDLREPAANLLVQNIKDRDGHLSTGFVGVGYLTPTLTETGHTDVAYRLLTNDTFPSWGYSIRQGATTIWERWDGWTKEHGFQNPGMNSFNHYSLGSVGQWMFATVGGIDLDPDRPGYQHILIHPRPGGGLSYAKATYHSIHGLIASDWKQENGVFTLNAVVPANTTATVFVPASDSAHVLESGRTAEKAEGVRFLRMEDGCAVYEVGSGNYRFSS